MVNTFLGFDIRSQGKQAREQIFRDSNYYVF